VKYRGGKPRGFTVLTARPKTGRAAAGEFNSPRPSWDGSAGIDTRTPGGSVRVDRSTTARQHPSHHVTNVGVERCRIPRNCRQLLRIKVFNPRRNCTRCYGGIGNKPSPSAVKVNKRTAFTLGVKWFENRRFSPSRKSLISERPRGTRPVPPVECRIPGLSPVSRDACVPFLERLSSSTTHSWTDSVHSIGLLTDSFGSKQGSHRVFINV